MGRLILNFLFWASEMYFRFATLAAVDSIQKARESPCDGFGCRGRHSLASPALAATGRDLLPVPFAGTYLFVATIAVVWLPIDAIHPTDEPASIRPCGLRETSALACASRFCTKSLSG
jgi:hypothetical protein